MPMILESTAFSQNGAMPQRYTCQGEDVSPPLRWSGVPQGCKSLVLIVDDPDAPDPAAPQRTWVHWILYNLPPAAEGLAEAVQDLPAGTKAGLNDDNQTGYGGPCPPRGTHRYFHKLYALDTLLHFEAPPTKAQIEKAMASHILAQAELIGLYKKS